MNYRFSSKIVCMINRISLTCVFCFFMRMLIKYLFLFFKSFDTNLSIHRRPDVSRPIVSLPDFHLPVFLTAVAVSWTRPAVAIKMAVQGLRTTVVASLWGRPASRRESVSVETASAAPDVTFAASATASASEGHLGRSQSGRVVPSVAARWISGRIRVRIVAVSAAGVVGIVVSAENLSFERRSQIKINETFLLSLYFSCTVNI